MPASPPTESRVSDAGNASEGMWRQRDGNRRDEYCCPTGVLRLAFKWHFRSLEITMLYILRVRRERENSMEGEHGCLSQPSIAACTSQASTSRVTETVRV